MIHVTITVKGGGGRVIRDWSGTVEELAQLEPTLEHLGGLPFASRLTVTLKEEGKEPATMTLLPGDRLGPVTATSGMLTGQPKLDEPPKPPAVPAGDPPLPAGTKVKATGVLVTTPNTDPYTIALPDTSHIPKPWMSGPAQESLFLTNFAGHLQAALDVLEPTIRWIVSIAPRPAANTQELQVHAETGWGTIAIPVRQYYQLAPTGSVLSGLAQDEAHRIIRSAARYISQVRVTRP